MSFLFNLFKSGNRSVTNSNQAVALENTHYVKWTKEQLIKRVLELESIQNEGLSIPHKKRKVDISTVTKKKKKEFDFSKHNSRFIALKFAYLGWNYNGLAMQKEATPLPTVEGKIIEAMYTSKLVPSMVPQEYSFSRCGRTDKGVSAMSQVISLKVRSNLTDEEQKRPENDPREIRYVHILNQLLPDDIRVSAVCLRPPEGFDARFSCDSRHYKYLFEADGLDISKMKEASSKYEGDHDFRNFCKLDGSKQITNHRRTIISAKILHVEGNIYCFDLVGRAFLWHQVRCMMANLLLVGQGLEEVSLIEDMLDIEKTPQKPIYDMADDLPLLLYDCKFPEMEWIESNLNNYDAVKYGKAVNALALHYQLKATIVNIFKNTLPTAETDFKTKTRINLGDGKGKVVTKYEKMKDREVMHSVETINSKYLKRKKAKAKIKKEELV
ncbi:pseudouridine synthase DEG1 NDAI_0B02200 [Naumovozyma dairenensis CBS 421]|uniref:Pseudouridine synthase I TruA alpha/beta domain-containing protein n=1 Tax=Naumovozyma dairenensis (strain ATCC 10597 / BCRC 20456 / CBS 421 / NBRC 0211 / NRRL Y-12639) TaxID=1071378 RepID=G0W644_NAUDC|nr:hypothetical protein NDAI_0B02200 [Naumovozyma dairenensis CBS 421]CCD23255.1 hypothetical protein NDAI_0B02200 [Naumovozyma dairenensis CBS 421]